MAKQQRITTKYAGVFYVEGPRIGGNGTETEQIFYIRYKKNGKLIEEKAGRQYKDNMSAAKANALRSLRLTGREPSNTERRLAEEKAKRQAEGRMTIGKLWERYLACRQAGKNKNNDRSRFDVHVAPYFTNRLPEEITTADVECWKSALLLKKLSPATVQRVMVVLRAVINFGVLRGFCPFIDPSKLQFKVMKVDNQKTEVLTDDELSRMLEALKKEKDQNAAALIRLALVTGMRKGALLALQWSDCDFVRDIITLRGEAAKKGRTDYIPMSASARAVLESIERADSPYVFPGRNGGQRTDYRRIARRVKAMAGLPADFRPLHGLRHNYASRLASSGKVDMYTLQKLLTHESPLMTQRYAHLADETLKRAAVVGDAALIPSIKNSKK